MSDEKRETADDIIAEMREIADNPECVAPTGLRHMADPLEAALKREKFAIEAEALTVGGMVEASRKSEMSKNVSKNVADFGQLGNAAALREALKNLVDVIDRYDSGSPLWWHDGAKGVMPLKNAKAALAAPPRNCDVGTPEEQTRRMANEYCYVQKDCYESPSGKSCPLYKTGVDCRLIWARMPYEEGGAE